MEKQKNSEKMGRRYDRDFKRDAVALVQGGPTITEVARSLGVSHWSLSRWVKTAAIVLMPFSVPAPLGP